MLRRMDERVVPPLTQRIRTELRDAVSAPDMLMALSALTNLRADLDTFERDRVRDALEDGVSFAAVARALGISRQAAHRRYRELVVPDTRPLTRVPLSSAGRATLTRARDEAAALGAGQVDGVHVILALIAAGYLPAPGLSIREARLYAGPPGDGVPARLGLALEAALQRVPPPVRIDDLLRAAHSEPAA